MDRDEILAQFQACTGIDDIRECIAHLEQSGWNLHGAVQSTLAAPGSEIVEGSRFGAHSLTNIQPNNDVWQGLASNPPMLASEQTLGSLDLQLPVQERSVPSNEPLEDDDSSHDSMEISEYEDDTEDFIHDTPSTSRPPRLMPDEAIDDEAAHAEFQSEFNRRHGNEATSTPTFFIGSLDNAIQEAFGGAARTRRILAVYLHHDNSIQSNVFCSQLLCAPSVVEYMASNCVIWAWDVTSDFNGETLLDMCSKHFGSGVAATVVRTPTDRFPMLVLAQGRGRSCEVNAIIQANTSLDDLTAELIRVVDDAEIQKKEAIRMEEQSKARQRIKREQDEAYEESLKQDKEKQQKSEAEKAELARQQREEELREEEKNKKIEQLKQIAPPEPNPKCGQPISKIRFRLPSGGGVISRAFLASEKLQGLLNFVGSLGYLSDKYRVIALYPKRDISSLDRQRSLQDHKLFPQEMMIIEEIAE